MILQNLIRGNSAEPGQVVPFPPPAGICLHITTTKPDGCQRCEYVSRGVGFCPDEVPPRPVIAAWLEAAGENEIAERRPLWGKAGKFAFYRLFGEAGLKREDVLICNTLRCRPFGQNGETKNGNKYPIGRLRQEAEKACRQYDAGIRDWNPDAFIITMHPSGLLHTPMIMRLVQSHVKHAVKLAHAGRRPLIIFGDKAKELLAPQLDGGLKRWCGHWWCGELRTRFE